MRQFEYGRYVDEEVGDNEQSGEEYAEDQPQDEEYPEQNDDPNLPDEPPDEPEPDVRPQRRTVGNSGHFQSDWYCSRATLLWYASVGLFHHNRRDILHRRVAEFHLQRTSRWKGLAARIDDVDIDQHKNILLALLRYPSAR